MTEFSFLVRTIPFSHYSPKILTCALDLLCMRGAIMFNNEQIIILSPKFSSESVDSVLKSTLNHLFTNRTDSVLKFSTLAQ